MNCLMISSLALDILVNINSSMNCLMISSLALDILVNINIVQ